jgi:hypothetical protein
MNIQEINYEELIDKLIKTQNGPDSLYTRIKTITNVADRIGDPYIEENDGILKILKIVCSLNNELNKEYNLDIRNWVGVQPISERLGTSYFLNYIIEGEKSAGTKPQASNCQSS